MVKKEGTALISKTPDKIEERPPDFLASFLFLTAMIFSFYKLIDLSEKSGGSKMNQ